MDFGGISWVAIDIIAVVILAAALIWGTMQWNKAKKDPELTRAREEGTRRNYERGG